MKKSLIISSLVLTSFIVLALTSIDSRDRFSTQATGDSIIIRYNPFPVSNKGYVSIHYGGDKVEDIQLTKEEVNRTISNYVVDPLTKFNSDGYELVSATSPGANDQITCFLKKKK